MRDEAEIRGHRRTYVGALPGRLSSPLKRLEQAVLSYALTKLDKMTMDFRAILRLRFLRCLILSRTAHSMIITLMWTMICQIFFYPTTANTLPDIPLPLQDGMEIIRISGYTEHEKYEIAVRHLVPKQIEANGLKKGRCQFTSPAIYKIIREYTREAGVRNLERELAAVCRKIAKEQAKDRENRKKFEVRAGMIQKYLGQPKFRIGYAETTDQIGIVTGMAWTPEQEASFSALKPLPCQEGVN